MIKDMKSLLVLKPDDNNPTPLYLQFSRKLEEAINTGFWKTDEALPSERAFCEVLGISRVTARKAMDLLLDQGLIVRKQGSGTYIAPKLEQPLSRLSSFSEELKQRGYEPGSRWVGRSIGTATQEEMFRLGLSPDSQVARLKRLRTADGVVMAVESSSLPVDILPDPALVTDSLYRYLDERGTPVIRALQHIKAVNASPTIAELAGIRPGDAILLITRIGYLENNVAVELTYSYCRSDYYDFVAELRR